MQCLFLRKCLVSCFHLWKRKNLWELASSFLIVNKFSVDYKRSPQSCQGVRKIELACLGSPTAAQSHTVADTGSSAGSQQARETLQTTN